MMVAVGEREGGSKGREAKGVGVCRGAREQCPCARYSFKFHLSRDLLHARAGPPP